MDNELQLVRFCYAPWGTFGRLQFPSGDWFYTVEQPWNNNAQGASCIPDGVYTLGLRYSPVVKRTSRGKYSEGWEVQNVPGRTYIMVHPGNWPGDVEGCIAVGNGHGVLRNRRGDYQQAVTGSQAAFEEIMSLLDQHDAWTLDIRPFIMQYP